MCNIFYAGDCVKITNGKLGVYLLNGEVKVFVPKTSSFFHGVYEEAEAPQVDEPISGSNSTAVNVTFTAGGASSLSEDLWLKKRRNDLAKDSDQYLFIK